MYKKIHYYMKILCFLVFLLAGTNLIAQPKVTCYADIGTNNVSEGLFIKAGTLGNYKFGNNDLGTGIQWDLYSNGEKLITGFTVEGQRTLSIKDFRFDVKGFYLYSGFTQTIKETNLGVTLKHQWSNVEIELGSSFKTFAFTRKAIEKYDLGEEVPVKIYENWNLIYLISGFLKPVNNPWNLGISLTNLDNFIINQETNPVINLKGFSEIYPGFTLFSEAWYKTAGAFNLNVNYFGFFLRTGIIWNIK